MELIEYQIYQNRVLGAHIIWEFAKSFTSSNNQIIYPSIFQTLPVLPLCLNRRVVEGVKSRMLREGSLIRAINDNRDIFSGLQERMESMAPITFNSIFIACKADLMMIDKETMTLVPNNRPAPKKITNYLQEDYTDILRAARRIGSWFSRLSVEEISMYFNIKF